MKNNVELGSRLVEWYRLNQRDLPWRKTANPYHIWLSEIILQQTRVAQGLPYYERFVNTFPSVKDLATASEQKVLTLWAGLGYYSRARNLLKAAKMVMSQFNGEFPTSYSELLKLPGIGDYTAAAIAAFSSNEKVVVVDGNVFRVLSRLFGIDADIAIAKNRAIFKNAAFELLNINSPNEFNQAIMEFG
ncbi:MAG: A/G-specific adenine glycosylase, partial [Bacteroidetes bacterium]|nr:A/G-specific adenine glycosylase [Bacteroidota bacterium]